MAGEKMDTTPLKSNYLHSTTGNGPAVRQEVESHLSICRNAANFIKVGPNRQGPVSGPKVQPSEFFCASGHGNGSRDRGAAEKQARYVLAFLGLPSWSRLLDWPWSLFQ